MISSIIGIAFDCPNANELADFYVKLSGWEKVISGDEFAAIRHTARNIARFSNGKKLCSPGLAMERWFTAANGSYRFQNRKFARSRKASTRIRCNKGRRPVL